MPLRILLLLFSALLSRYAMADMDDLMTLSLEELLNVKVVTAASGFDQNTRRAPATVTVITNEEWQAKGSRLLSDVLATVPGLHVSKPQVEYQHKKFYIRGLSGHSSSQIKLLIDGESLELMQNGGIFHGFHMPLNGFKRIEVVKGPGSAIYGSDAFAGIINLVTFKQREIESQLGGRAGSFNTYDFFARSEFDIKDSHFQWSFDYIKSSDDKNRIVSSDLQSIFDGIFGTMASMAPGRIDEHYEILVMNAKWQLDNLSLDYFSWRNFEMGLGAGIAQALDNKGYATTHANHYKLQYDFSDNINVEGTLKATFSYKQQKNQTYLNVFPAGTVLPIGADGNADFVNPAGFTLFTDGYIGRPIQFGETMTYNLNHLINTSETNKVRWELGYEKQNFQVQEYKNFGPGILNGTQGVVSGQLTNVSGTPYVYLPNTSRNFHYLSLQDEWQIEEYLQLTMGIRYDNYSDFGTTINPRFGLIWNLTDSLAVKLFAGSAFKTPTYSQLYGQNNPVGIGNPKLGPENIDTMETGFNAEYLIDENLLMSFSLFQYKAKDLVDFVVDGQLQGNVAQNTGKQLGQGGEFAIKWKPQTSITVDFNYSFLSTEDNQGNSITDIPEQLAYFSFNWSISDHWNWNIDSKWVADRKRNSLDPRPELANYNWVNTKLLRRNIINNLDIAVTVNNLFDTDAKEPSNGSIADDYPLPGRQLLLEIVYRF